MADFGVEFDRLAEGLFGRRRVAFRRLEAAEHRVRPGRLRVELDRLLDLLNGAVEVLQAEGRVPQQELRLEVLRVELQRLLRSRLRIVVAPGEHEERAGLELRLLALRQEVGGVDVLADGPRRLSQADVCLGELEVGVAELGVLLDGVPVLDHRLFELLLGEVLVAALVELLRALRAAGHDCRRQHEDHQRLSRVHVNLNRLKQEPGNGGPPLRRSPTPADTVPEAGTSPS